MFAFFRRLLRRDHGADLRHVEADPSISRAGAAVAGMRPGSQRHRPSQQDRDLADRLGVEAYDPTDRRL